MPYVTVGKENGANIDIYYKDWGSGQPIFFSYGWPLSADDWDAQMLFFPRHGYRVIAHDRRGHGRSSQPWNGNDMDTYAGTPHRETVLEPGDLITHVTLPRSGPCARRREGAAHTERAPPRSNCRSF
jgi:pimeloyl-ACP methyl ester carboxylesterase